MMTVDAQVTINAPKHEVWSVISDIEHAPERIGGIEKVEILERPRSGLVGLKWRETRKMFGKSASEVMWITDAVDYEYYRTRAESHGTVYLGALTLSERDGATSLTMTFESAAQSLMAKLIEPLGFALKGTMKKMILKDLNDIKTAVEQRRSERSA